MRNVSTKHIKRKVPPTKRCEQPYGTVCEVKDEYTYVQVNRIHGKPHWVRMAIFLEIALKDLFKDDLFMKKCCGLFQINEQKR